MTRFDARLERLERALVTADADGAVVATGSNARYFTGFAGERDRALLFVITPDGERLAVSPEQYTGQVRRAIRADDVHLHSVPHNSARAVARGVAERLSASHGRYLVDEELSAGELYHLERAFPNATVDLLGPVVTPMRATKDESERRALRRAARLTDEVSHTIREAGADVVGTTERELAVQIRARLHERGAEGVAFPVVVASGPNGALPTQYRHGDRTIERGEPVVLDFGGFFDGYASDQTRTVVFAGEPSASYVEAHDAVREALQAGIGRVEPGTTGGELDAAVRDVIVEHGYGDQFTTGTGHGVGLRAHEPPSIAPGSDDVLEPGMVFSIEPGIYVAGEFGVRLETLVLLTERGPEVLNDSPYTWRPP